MLTWYPEQAAMAFCNAVVFAEAFPDPVSKAGCEEQAARVGAAPAPAALQSMARDGDRTPVHACPREICEIDDRRIATQIRRRLLPIIAFPLEKKRGQYPQEPNSKEAGLSAFTDPGAILNRPSGRATDWNLLPTQAPEAAAGDPARFRASHFVVDGIQSNIIRALLLEQT
jgi:hypothetical protein